MQRYNIFLTYAKKIIDFRFGRLFLCLGHLSAFRSSMFALQTRAAHLLLDCPPDTLRCALTASQLSLGGYKSRRGSRTDASPYYTRMCTRYITIVYLTCGGRICNATERFPERQRREWHRGGKTTLRTLGHAKG